MLWKAHSYGIYGLGKVTEERGIGTEGSGKGKDVLDVDTHMTHRVHTAKKVINP